MVSPSIHGRPAHGIRSTERRAATVSTYGLSMKTSARHHHPGPVHAQHPEQEEHARAGDEQERGQPQALGHPVGGTPSRSSTQ